MTPEGSNKGSSKGPKWVILGSYLEHLGYRYMGYILVSGVRVPLNEDDCLPLVLYISVFEGPYIPQKGVETEVLKDMVLKGMVHHDVGEPGICT